MHIRTVENPNDFRYHRREKFIMSPTPCVRRKGMRSFPLHATNPTPSIYLSPRCLRPHIPRRGNLRGPSACVSLTLTSRPFLSAPDLPTSLRGCQQHARRVAEGGRGWGAVGGVKGKGREDIDRDKGKTREEGRWGKGKCGKATAEGGRWQMDGGGGMR